MISRRFLIVGSILRRDYSFARRFNSYISLKPSISSYGTVRFSSECSNLLTRWAALWLGCLIGTSIITNGDSDNSGDESQIITLDDICKDRYSCIIVGAGTAGCTAAYLVAKWLLQHNVDGKVLLIDRGVDYFSNKNGPDPRIDAWWYNWGSFGESHPSIRENGSAFPVTASDHKGVGGCSTHDTRITFAMNSEQRRRVANEMGWSVAQIATYFQAALNLMPLCRSIPTPEPFYTACIDALTKQSSASHFQRVEKDEYKSEVIRNTIAEPSLAMYESNGVRWTPAWLLDNSLRPPNLVVLPETSVNRIIWDHLLLVLKSKISRLGNLCS